MKITATAKTTTLIAAIDATVDTANAIQPEAITGNQHCEALNKLHKSSRNHKFAGGSWQYTTDGETGTMDIEIDDEAIVMMLPAIVKIAKATAPLINLAKTAIGMMENIGDQIKGIMDESNRKFVKRFGGVKTYAVGTIWCEDLEAFDVVVLEDDGFENVHAVNAEHCGAVNSMDVITKLAVAAWKKGEATKGSWAKRYPEWEFKAMSRKEAVEIARSMRSGLQADVDGWREGQNKTMTNGMEEA